MESVTLVGAEAVQRAGSQMSSAAEQMSLAASSFDHSLMMHQRFLDDWLYRLEAVIEKASGSMEREPGHPG